LEDHLNLKNKNKQERQIIIDAEITKFNDPKNYRDDSLCRYLKLVNKKPDGKAEIEILTKLVNDYKIDVNSKNRYGDTALFEVNFFLFRVMNNFKC
jgi:hypothetical protein